LRVELAYVAHLMAAEGTSGVQSIPDTVPLCSAYSEAVDYRSWQVVVDAEGYRSHSAWLRSLTRDPSYHARGSPPPIVVRLDANTPP
jgi:hypothetical protein